MIKSLIAANWKMNCSNEFVSEFFNDFDTSGISEAVELLVCPPALYIPRIVKADAVSVGGQDCSPHVKGAYTGEISAEMLKDSGCEYVILGHSERRQYHSETDDLICQKAEAAISKGLKTIICVGETQAERESGDALNIVTGQILSAVPASATPENCVIAYEPVWAIGTGLTAETSDIDEMHQEIKKTVQKHLASEAMIRIIYGGSVKPENAEEIFSLESVHGALIGGASLDPQSFLQIATHAK